MRAFQRVVATIAVVSLLSVTGLNCIHHTAHAGHHEARTATQTTMPHASDHHHDASQHTNDDASHAIDTAPASPSDHSDDISDCTHCSAAHCFACVMPANASMLLPWMVAKKTDALCLFAAPPPTWRLERPPKNTL